MTTFRRSLHWHRRALRRLPMLLGMLLALAALAALYVQLASDRRLDREYAISTAPDASDPALREQGARLARSRGCADCHGDDFGGKLIADAMPFARLAGSDLTRPPRGHPGAPLHERLYRALHHGVGMDSRPLLMMPSKEFASLSAREIEAIAAFLATVPPARRATGAAPLPDSALGPLGRTLLVAGRLEGFLSAETIDHATPAVAAPPPAGTLAAGAHAAQLCTGCHRADFGGGRMSHGPPSLPPAANLTADASGLGHWSEAQFIAAMRTGLRPDGSAIDGQAMPWRAVGQADDEELRAIWRYLRTRPPVPGGAARPR